MHPFLLYIIRSTAIAGIFYTYYHLLLRNNRLHTYNRAYMLSAMLLSLVIPLLHFSYTTTSAIHNAAPIRLLNVISTGGADEAPVPPSTTSYSITTILWIAYFTTAALIIGSVIIKVVRLYALRRRSSHTISNGIYIIDTDHPSAPFSFLNNLFWQSSIDRHSPTGSRILQHETIHIRQHHTLDKLFTKLLLAFFWSNPFFWLFQKELSLVHEFLADEGSIRDNDTSALAALLLHSQFGNRFTGIIQPFFYSPVKRRLLMLKTTNTTHASLRRLLALPVVAATVLLFSFSARQPHTTRAHTPMLLVLDAGHGGTDHGAIAKNGLEERDLTLQITQEMTRLAPEYNISIIPTRTGNTYPTLNERAHAADGKNADAFVSIHINKDGDNGRQHNNFEVNVSHQNKYYAQSKLLASAIIASCERAPTTLNDNRSLHVLKANSVPAVLIECGNIDNPNDVEMFQNPQQLEKMCRNILSGIAMYKNADNK